MGPERKPPEKGAEEMGPEGKRGTGCSGTAAKDSELSKPEEAVESSGSRRSAEVESGVETLAESAAPEMARKVVASSAAALASGTSRSPSSAAG